MGCHRFDPENAAALLDDKRARLLDMHWLIDQLALRPGAVCLDVGAGNGLFTLPLANASGGTVYAVDIEPRMLALLETRAAQHAVDTVVTIIGSAEQLPLPRSSVDAFIAGFVLHEVLGRVTAVAELARVVKPGGRGAVVEWADKRGELGPPSHERIASAQLTQEFSAAGFSVENAVVTDEIYILVLRRGGGDHV